jgi:hypothetical protein
MVRVLASTQTKDYKIGMCCFSSNQVALRHRLVGSESKLCIQVDRHVYPRTVVSVSVMNDFDIKGHFYFVESREIFQKSLRLPKGKQKPEVEEEQTTQWPR